jgi:hypothetical protein
MLASCGSQDPRSPSLFARGWGSWGWGYNAAHGAHTEAAEGLLISRRMDSVSPPPPPFWGWEC